MTPTPIEKYLSEFTGVQSSLSGQTLPWLSTIRRKALQSIKKNGFPHRKHEEWKYTDISNIAERFYQPTHRTVPANLWKMLNDSGLDLTACFPVIFVDGRYKAEFSNFVKLPEGVTIEGLAAVIETKPEWLREQLARFSEANSNIFTDLNTAFMNDGIVIRLSKKARITQPIQLVFVSTKQAEPVLSQPRNLIILEEAAEAVVIQKFISLNPASDNLTNVMTDIFLGQRAELELMVVQAENIQTSHINSIRVKQETRSLFSSRVFTFGGSLTRNNLDIEMDAEDASCTLDGLFMIDGLQHVDNHTRVDHKKPGCTSSELYKGILDDGSHGVFNGKVYVHQDAQQTNAFQKNPNLLLSRDAEIDTKPQLEIYADDVRCSHGATVGQLDEPALFYLRSRGMDVAAARDLLIYSFAEEIIKKVPFEPLRKQLIETVTDKLSEADILKEMQ
ncbi:Fe-S cluster assembly protein SufD [bacterium]|nr:Fe-S cluster assembly protein SufD [bacterium]